MKKLPVISVILSAFLLAFTSCNKEAFVDNGLNCHNVEFTASIEQYAEEGTTKTSLSAQNSILWSEGDELAIFQGATIADKYKVKQGTAGSSNGTFSFVQRGSANVNDDFVSGTEIPANVAVYPYESDLAISADGERFVISNVTFPALQSYTPNSFPQGAFCMVAVTESISDHVLRFRNVVGALKLQLLGTKKVKSIKLEGNNNEVLGGEASIVAYGDGTVPKIVMDDAGSKSIVLDCGDGVQLSSDNVTNFIIALPPTNFEKGFTVTVTDTDGIGMPIVANVGNNVCRSSVLKMPNVRVPVIAEEENIEFEDELVKEICVSAFDTNEDGELSYDEASAVTDFSVAEFREKNIESFEEFKYFTSLTTLPDYTFYGCSSLLSITLPEGLTEIGGYVFVDCASLASIVLPQKIESIGNATFYGCSALSGIVFPEDLKVIGDAQFAKCMSLSSITLPAGLTSLGATAFLECAALISITIPDNISTIEASTFSGCSSLSSVVLPKNLATIETGAFDDCILLTSLTIPNDVESIGLGAFSGCSSLKSVIFPEGLKVIGDGAFGDCISLLSVSLPKSLNSLGDVVFYGCSSLQTCTIESSSLTSYGESPFYNCNNLGAIYVPYESVNTFKSKWVLHASLIKAIQ